MVNVESLLSIAFNISAYIAMWCIEAALYSWRESTRYNIKEILHIQNVQQVYHEELLGTLFYTLIAISNEFCYHLESNADQKYLVYSK